MTWVMYRLNGAPYGIGLRRGQWFAFAGNSLLPLSGRYEKSAGAIDALANELIERDRAESTATPKGYRRQQRSP